jgi:hypothetical protein
VQIHHVEVFMRKPTPQTPLPVLLLLALLAPSSACTRELVRGDAGPGSRPDAPTGTDFPDSALPGFDATCESIMLRSTPTVSNVLVVLDRSSSMYREAGFGVPGVDRWNPAVAAIRSVTASLDDRVQFGLMLFANPDAPAGMTLCGAGKVDVAPAPDTGPAIAAELTGDPNELTGSWTPTAVSLAAARTALSGLPGRSYVLLVTDGAPNCNSSLDGARCRCGSDTMSCADNPRLCIDEDRSVAEVAALHEAGIDTYVVGYETSAWADVLDRMAAAGGTGRTSHIPVGDEASLRSALTEIAGSVISCTVELSGPPDVVEFVQVTLDGVDVPHESVARGDASWALVDERFVQLRGAACTTLRDGAAHDLAIRRECQPLF